MPTALDTTQPTTKSKQSMIDTSQYLLFNHLSSARIINNVFCTDSIDVRQCIKLQTNVQFTAMMHSKTCF